jgi:hypothetical protein
VLGNNAGTVGFYVLAVNSHFLHPTFLYCVELFLLTLQEVFSCCFAIIKNSNLRSGLLDDV